MPPSTARRAATSAALGALLLACACDSRAGAGDGDGLEARWGRGYAAPARDDLTHRVSVSGHRGGGVLAWGYLQEPRTLGDVTLTPEGTNGSGWLLHLGTEGAQRWAWSPGGAHGHWVVHAESDAEGHTWALVNTNTGQGVKDETGAPTYELARQVRLVRLGPDGVPVGTWTLGAPDARTEGTGLVVDPAGQTVTVSLESSATLDLGAGRVLPRVGPLDTVLVEHSLDGAVRSARRIGGEGPVRLRLVAHTQAGRLLLGSAPDATLALGPEGTGHVEVGSDYVLVREGPDGRVQRLGALPGFLVERLVLQLYASGLDAEGNGYLLARARGQLDLGFGPLRNTTFLVKYGANGERLWAQNLGHALGRDLDVAPDGRVLVVGDFVGDVQLDDVTLYAAGGQDLFVAAFDRDGQRVAHRGFGSWESAEAAWGVAWGADGRVYVGGQSPGRIELEGEDLEPPRDQVNTLLLSLEAP